MRKVGDLKRIEILKKKTLIKVEKKKNLWKKLKICINFEKFAKILKKLKNLQTF